MRRIIFGCVALTAFAGSTFGANLIVNGGFEEGVINFTSPIPHWDGTGGVFATDSTFGFGNHGPHSGVGYGVFSTIGSLHSMSQAIATTPGQAYTLDYFFASDGFVPNQFQVLWNNAVLFDETDIPSHDYREYSFSVIGTGSDTVVFAGRNDHGYLNLDDVSLQAVAVPEPSTMLLCGIGLIGLAGVASRRRSMEK